MSEKALCKVHELSTEQEALATNEFEQVLADAMPAHKVGQLESLRPEEERYIQQEVERMLYESKLPCGGNKERAMIERLARLAKDTEWKGHRRAAYAIAEWKKVLADNPRNPAGHYCRKPLTPRGDKENWQWCMDLRAAAHTAKQWDRKWFAQMMLDGLPELVSNFEMQCLFLLRQSDGTVKRLVQFRNDRGEVSQGPHHKGAVELDEDAFAAPEKFRKFCLKYGNFAWRGNQTSLHDLHLDILNSTAWKVVNRIDSVGSHKARTHVFWFLDDCAYVDGELLLPDEDGIYNYCGESYYLNTKGRETEFAQGRPKMLPEMELVKGTNGNWELVKKTEDKRQREELAAAYREFFRDVCNRFYDTAGGHEGWLSMGAIFAYLAAPELFAAHGLFPGLFIHGQMGSGKTLYTEWLLHLAGYRVSAGIGLLKGTPVGLLCDCENYSNQPLWCDEYRQGKINEDKEAILRDGYNRQPPIKWTPPGEVQRQMKTSFIVSGESTSADAALQSRYPHVQISKTARLKNHLEWMQANKRYFFVLTRLVYEQRAEFVSLVQRLLEDWLKTPEMAGMNERERMVHGIDWASWQALCTLLDSHEAVETDSFLTFMIEHAKRSAHDVTSETNTNVFLTQMLTTFKADAIPLKCFRLEWDEMPHPPGQPNRGIPTRPWRSARLYVDPNPTVAAIEIHLAKGRNQITLRPKDLRDQLSKEGFWEQGNPNKRFSRVAGETEMVRCWGFLIDKMELGLQSCTDEEWAAYLACRQDDDGRGDPRKGPFFAIIHALEKAKAEHRNENR